MKRSDKLFTAHGEAHEEWSVARQELDLDLLEADAQPAKIRAKVKRLDAKWRAVLKKLVGELVKTHPRLKKWVA